MPAQTKEQVSGGVRFQAEGAHRITGMLPFCTTMERLFMDVMLF